MSFAVDDNDQPQSQVDSNGVGSSSPNQQAPTDFSGGISLGGGASGVSAGGGSVGSSTPGQPASPAPAKPSSSGSWTNLNSYLSANADQGAQIGTQIAGNVNGQAQNAQNDVNSAADAFSQNVNANTVKEDDSQVNQALSDAQSGTLGANDVTDYQNQANATYNGPTDFTQAQGYGTAQTAVDQATQAVNQTTSESGRDNLLQQQYAGASQNGYNQGETNLDQMLLENTPQNQQTLGNLQNQWSGLGNALTTATNQGDALAAQAMQTDQATAQAAQNALSGANTSFQGAVNGGLSTIQNDNSAYLAQHVNDHDPSAGHVASQDPATVYNTATAQQYAESAALAQLAGLDPSQAWLPSQDASQAGMVQDVNSMNHDFDPKFGMTVHPSNGLQYTRLG